MEWFALVWMWAWGAIITGALWLFADHVFEEGVSLFTMGAIALLWPVSMPLYCVRVAYVKLRKPKAI